MLTPTITIIIIAVLFVLYAFIIPLMDASERFSSAVSLRYYITLIPLFMFVAVCFDFQHLDEEARKIVIYGGLGSCGLFVLFRSLEKLTHGKKVKIKGQTGNTSGEIEVEGKEKESE